MGMRQFSSRVAAADGDSVRPGAADRLGGDLAQKAQQLVPAPEHLAVGIDVVDPAAQGELKPGFKDPVCEGVIGIDPVLIALPADLVFVEDLAEGLLDKDAVPIFFFDIGTIFCFIQYREVGVIGDDCSIYHADPF